MQKTNRAAQPVPNHTGPTCQGSVGATADGRILVSAPHWPHWRYPADRRNMSVMAFEVGAANASANGTRPLRLVGEERVWAGPAAYSSIVDGARAMLFEGGAAYRYASVLFARLAL